MNARITGSIVAVSARLPSKACTCSGKPLASVSSPMVICGSRRRSLLNPGSRNPSPVSVSKYSVDTSNSTRLDDPSRACAAHAAESCCRHSIFAYPARRRFTVGYDAGTSPASSRTRPASSLLVGSISRANTRSRNTTSPPVAT